MKTNRLARIYAQSLYDLVREQGEDAEDVRDQLSAIKQLFESEPSFFAAFESPRVLQKQKFQLLDTALAPHFSKLVINTLKILIHKKREKQVLEIIQEFSNILDKAMGRLHVQVTSAVQLNQEHLQTLTSAIQKKFAKEPVLHNQVDEALLGGMVVQINDIVVDFSIAKELKQIRERIISHRVRSEEIYEN